MTKARSGREEENGVGEIIGIAAPALLCHMTAAFLVSLVRRDNGLADVA